LSGTITPLALTVTGSSVTSKVYDGTTVAAITGGSLSGVLNADQSSVTLSQSGVFSTKNAGNSIGVTATDTISATGTAAGDYTLTEPTGLTGAITPKPITVNGTTGLNKTYDGTTSLAANVTGYATPSGFISGDVVALTGGPVYSSPNAGSRTLLQGTVTLAGTNASDYSVSWVNGSGTITPAPLTVTANPDARFVGLTDTAGYNGVSYQGLVDGQTSGVLAGTLSISRSNAGVGAAGTYSGVLVPSGLTSGNYAITFAPGAYTIVPADELLVRASNTSTTYGSAPTYAISSVQYLNDNNVVVTLSQTGVNGSTYAYSDGVGGTATFTLGATGSVLSGGGNLAAGNYAIGDSSFAATGSNFRGSPVVVGELTVNPLGLTASASNPPTKVYDGTNSMSGTSIALSGVLPGDAVTGSGIGTFTNTNAGTGLSYSLNGLTLSGADAGDYYLTNGVSAVGNNGTITPLALTVTGSAVTAKTYDGTTAATITGGTLSGVLSADQAYVSLSAQSGTFASKNAGSGIAVTAADVLSVTGPAAGDYTLIEPLGLSGTITPLALTVTGSSVTSKVYDGTTVAAITGGSLSGVLGADASSISLTQAGTYASKNAGTHIAVTASDSLSGADSEDYTLIEPVNLTGTIIPRTVTLSDAATAVSKTYDGTTTATLADASLANVVPGDGGALSLVGTFATPNAGQHITVTVVLSGANSGDYVLGNPPNLSANINPAPLVATANPVSTPLGSVLPTLGGSFSGFVDGQTLAALEAAGYQVSWRSGVSDQSAAGQYAITGSFTDPNYTVVQASGNATAFNATFAASTLDNTSASVIATVATLPPAGINAAGAETSGGGAGVSAAGSSGATAADGGGAATTDGGGAAMADGGGAATGSVSGTSASTGGVASMGLGANSVTSASDGTVSLNETGGGGATSAQDAGSADSASGTARGLKTESQSDFGGRRLIVVSGGVNTNLAR
jgi:hypothetical protein